MLKFPVTTTQKPVPHTNWRTAFLWYQTPTTSYLSKLRTAFYLSSNHWAKISPANYAFMFLFGKTMGTNGVNVILVLTLFVVYILQIWKFYQHFNFVNRRILPEKELHMTPKLENLTHFDLRGVCSFNTHWGRSYVIKRSLCFLSEISGLYRLFLVLVRCRIKVLILEQRKLRLQWGLSLNASTAHNY